MRTQRLALASGAIYVVAILIGNGLYEQGAGPAHTVGLAMEILGFTAFLVFLGALYRTVRRVEGPDGWLATTALGAGLVTIAVKLGSVAPLMAANLRADELTSDLARTLDDLGAAAWVISGYTSGIFVAACGAAVLATGVLPRWLGYVGVVVGVLTIAAGTAGVVDPGGYVPVPYLLSLLWVLGASATMAVRGPRPVDAGTEHRAAGPVPAGAAGTA